EGCRLSLAVGFDERPVVPQSAFLAAFKPVPQRIADRAVVGEDRHAPSFRCLSVDSSARTIPAPHVHVIQTRSASTPLSSSPQCWCSWKKALRASSSITSPSARAGPRCREAEVGEHERGLAFFTAHDHHVAHYAAT